MKFLFNFSILALIWTIYYLAMHITGGILTKMDAAVCGITLIGCCLFIVCCLFKLRKKD